MAQNVDQPQSLHASDTASPATEEKTQVVQETRPQPPAADQSSTRTPSANERVARMHSRHSGFYWGTDFIGFAVASWFAIVFLGIVGAIVGAVGFQLHTPVPKIGGSIAGATQNLGIGALIGSVIAVFLAYLIGGYTAGRMARFSGALNGLGVWIWTIVVAIILGIAGAIAGSNFNVASQLHLNVSRSTLAGAGGISLAVTLVIMLIGAVAGGTLGQRHNRTLDREQANM